MGRGDSGCGIGLLGVASNKLVTIPRHNSIRPLGSCCSYGECTADCKSLATKPAEQWKTTIDLPHMNLIIFPTSASPTSLFKHNKSVVVFHCCKTFAICCNYYSYGTTRLLSSSPAHSHSRSLTIVVAIRNYGAYGKAGNGSGMETGNGKWKWKLEMEI